MTALPTATMPPEDRPERPDTVVWRTALLTAGILLGLIGTATLAAWATGNIEYVQIDSSLHPFHYNSALGLLIWGAGFIALARGRHRAARIAAYVLMACVLVLVAAQYSSTRFGLDRWLFPPHASSRSPMEGAPPPLIVGLTLAAIAIQLAARARTTAAHAILGLLIGLILIVGGVTAFLAARAGIVACEAAGLSMAGAIASNLAGLALLTSAMRRRIPTFTVGRTLPAMVGAVGVAITFALWVGLNSEQNLRLHRQVQFEAALVHRLVAERLPAEIAEIADLSERWPRTDREQLNQDTGSYAGRHPSCHALARVEPNRTVTWVELRQIAALRTSLAELGVAESVELAMQDNRAVAIRPTRSYWQGNRMLILFVPDRRPAPNTGGLLVVFRLQEFFDSVLNANVAPGYAITVVDGSEQIFGRNAKEETYLQTWVQVLSIRFQSFDWQLSVWPTHHVMQRESPSLPRLALVIGVLMTSLLAMAVHLAQTARRRTAALENEVREREQTQQALKLSEQKYRSLIENLGQGIFLLDRELRYVAANATFCRGLGRDEGGVIGLTDAELFDAAQAARHRDEAASVLAEGKTVESEEDREVAGRRMSIHRVLTPVRDPSGVVTGVLGICWDVTEQRQLESHVHQASKMDAIGQLAGGIAHDFNNLLTAILGNLDLILEDDATGASTRELAASAHGAAARAASLTHRLLGFSRRHSLDWVATDLNAIVEEVVALLRRTIDPLVRIETRLSADLWSVQADPAQINQMLMNLCLNARDAMPGGGRITISTASVDSTDLPLLVGRTGGFVRLSVTDTGEGMTDEVKARVYEPFFTTKDVGKGTGLGLAMVFAIVRQHKGWITCSSEIGSGTTFEIFLPRGVAVLMEDSGRLTPIPRRTGKETILVVDDEESIRRLAVLTLGSHGYTVREAADGQEALDLYEREGEGIDIVLLDLTMPVLSGHETFRRLLQQDPHVKVVFASGYAVEQLSDFEKELMTGFLKKPYRTSELVTVIQDALQRHTPSPERHARTLRSASLELANAD